MATVLLVETSPRQEHSVSRNLSLSFVTEWKKKNPDDEIVLRDLSNTVIPYVSEDWLQAYFTPPDNQTSAMKDALALSDSLVRELINCDHLVISTPVYNYNVPAKLKSWFDNIVRKGITLGFDGKGMLKKTKATVLLASGGVYSPGSPIEGRDIAHRYLILMLNVLGIEDVVLIAGEGAKSVDLGEVSMETFVGGFESQVKGRVSAV
ncbi:FMN-dependent NADH-azoreductase [Marinobacter adhaerens]|uniref:FMN-dependent NADH-azoreductase n=1 Tax=Marinobacter adhaerens TaxID=1033846 RepID=UPI001E487635|nr:NAD(P)H-dependent oxidoreductase [Marinobacter adhaerens]MCD1647296.1 NAD(P)H-dependent oxidoreductase [Marinobacter adhaerens]